MTNIHKIISFAVILSVVLILAVVAEEITYTTIIPRQDIARGKSGVIGSGTDWEYTSSEPANGTLMVSDKVAIGVQDTADLDANAALQIDSTTQGILIPRLNATTITNMISPPDGMLVYNVTNTRFECFMSGVWQILHTRPAGQGLPVPDMDAATDDGIWGGELRYNYNSDALEFFSMMESEWVTMPVRKLDHGLPVPDDSEATTPTPNPGEIRYNSSTGYLEYYDGNSSVWQEIARMDDVMAMGP